MSNQQILQRARNLISTPTRWCKDTYGCKPNGEFIQDKHDVDASCVCLCTMGALIVAADHDDQAVKLAASALAMGIPRNNPASSSIPHVAVQRYNDQSASSHEMILALFDLALLSCKRKIQQRCGRLFPGGPIMEDQNGDSLGKRVEVTLLSGRTQRGTVQAVEHGYTTIVGKNFSTTSFEVLMDDGTMQRTAAGWCRELGPEWAEELLPKVRQYARERYEEGWSPLVECDSSRIIEAVVKHDLRDLEAIVKHYKPIMEALHSRYMDMRALSGDG